MPTETPHIRWPISVGTSFAVLEQDSDEDIGQCIVVVAHYERGDRECVPEFGIGEYPFRMAQDITGDAVAADIMRWENRAQIDGTERFGANVLQRVIEIRARRSERG